MGLILSLQGSMAVGKTTAAQYIAEHYPNIHVSFEENKEVLRKLKNGNYQKDLEEDFVKIQRLWIENEIVRWEACQSYPVSLMDFGAEEIEFYTLNYPKTLGEQWDIESKLEKELEALRKCLPKEILFLAASESVLKHRKEGDHTRKRHFFDYYLTHLLPLKQEYFQASKNVTFFVVSNLSVEETGEKIVNWIHHQLKLFDQ